MVWSQLTHSAQLDEIVELSSEKTVVIFKHSTRCSISSMALNRFERNWSLDEKVGAYFLDLIAHRDISNAIAKRFDVQHESPQLLIIKNGKCVFNSSHNMINASDVESQHGA